MRPVPEPPDAQPILEPVPEPVIDRHAERDAEPTVEPTVVSYAEADRRRVEQAAQAERDRSMIAHGRRIGGLPGAVVAGAMIAIRDVYEGPKRDEAPVVVDAPSEPHDVDRDGLRLAAEEIGGADGVAVPPLPPRQPLVRRRARRR